MQKYDFIAIGDITTDAFIRIKDASVHCDVNKENCTLCVRFGDKIPYEFVEIIRAVGNSPNAAVGARRLGLSSALISNMGDDQNGRECLETLTKENVATEYVKVHPGKATNYHYVLWYENERTILIKHEAYDYRLPDISGNCWLYLSSLGENSLPFHEEIANFVESHENVHLVFQPGTFQMKLGYEKLKRIYGMCKIFFCNIEEAKRILGTEESDISTLLAKMRDLGPKMIVMTDGPKGAYVQDENATWFMPPYPDPKEPYDRTGAGDAFASTFISALALGKSIPEALSWAPINAMSVRQEIGAQRGLLSRHEIEQILATAPPDYAPRKIDK